MNKPIRTIIIDNDSKEVNNMKSHFLTHDLIKVTNVFKDGKSAEDYIINHTSEFDLILMDLLLPMLDGISLLSELKDRKINKKIIVISSYKDEYLLKRSLEYNISYFMIKPISYVALENRITDIFNTKESIKQYRYTLDLEISHLLHNLGIPSHIRGYKYIREGVTLIYNTDDDLLITKEVYPQIAIKYETTPSRVERAIRHAIEVSCIRGDLSLMEDLFGFSVSTEKAKPTNSEFLITIAERIKLANM